MIIKIKNLKLETILGIYDWEQVTPRPIIINATIFTSNDKARFSDKIEDTIDYDIIVKQIKSYVASKNFQLIEKMAQDLLDIIMKDDRVTKCELEVDKVGVIEDVESLSITLTEER